MAKLSKLVAVAIMALLGISVFAGSAMVMGDFDKGFHTVEVDLAGSMRLVWWNVQTDNITIQQNFTAKVPAEITPGNYIATFEGFARIDEESIEFNGVIETENGTFMAEFQVPNASTLSMGECGASGNLTLLISETILPPPVQYECVRVVGRVTGFGNSNASGLLNANAKISNSTVSARENVSEAHVCWVPLSGSIPLPSPQWEEHNATGNFTYSFYTATLINTTMIALNYSGNDFYVSGLWSVLNVTFSFSGASYEDFQKTESYVRQNATGELEVYGNGKNFTLSIAGFDKVTGSVERFVTNAKTVLEGDVLNHGVVDIYDLVYVARRFGATPGDPKWGGLSNFEDVDKADVNKDNHVDVYDLVTVATEIGQTG